MDFYSYPLARDASRKGGGIQDLDTFYRPAFAHAAKTPVSGVAGQLIAEQAWELAQRPYYNVWPSIVPMVTRLSLDIDSNLIRLPLPALCVRLPKRDNPLTFDWQGQAAQIRSILLGESKEAQAILMMFDLGETKTTGRCDMPIGSFCNFARNEGVTVEQAIAALPRRPSNKGYIDIPEAMLSDCVRLCCSLCLLEADPSIITPDVLSKDRDEFDRTGDQKYVEKAHRRGRLGWDVGKQVEVIPHYRRPHFDAGLDRGGPDSAQNRAATWYNRASEQGGSGAERVWSWVSASVPSKSPNQRVAQSITSLSVLQKSISAVPYSIGPELIGKGGFKMHAATCLICAVVLSQIPGPRSMTRLPEIAEFSKGDRIVTIREAPLMEGKTELAKIKPETRLTVAEVRGQWLLVTVIYRNKERKAWVSSDNAANEGFCVIPPEKITRVAGTMTVDSHGIRILGGNERGISKSGGEAKFTAKVPPGQIESLCLCVRTFGRIYRGKGLHSLHKGGTLDVSVNGSRIETLTCTERGEEGDYWSDMAILGSDVTIDVYNLEKLKLSGPLLEIRLKVSGGTALDISGVHFEARRRSDVDPVIEALGFAPPTID